MMATLNSSDEDECEFTARRTMDCDTADGPVRPSHLTTDANRRDSFTEKTLCTRFATDNIDRQSLADKSKRHSVADDSKIHSVNEVSEMHSVADDIESYSVADDSERHSVALTDSKIHSVVDDSERHSVADDSERHSVAVDIESYSMANVIERQSVARDIERHYVADGTERHSVEDDIEAGSATDVTRRSSSNESETETKDERTNDNVTHTKGTRKTDDGEPQAAWSQEEIQALLVKAINFRAPLKDIRTVIQCGADVNRPITSGLHPIHYAAYADDVACVELLLKSGANVNATDEIGYTPLHLAARRGNQRTLSKLIENGAIINFNEPGVVIHNTEEKNKLGFTTTEPINLAIQNGNVKCAELLLDNGARVNNKYFMGYEISLAPLDDVDCLEVLLKHGADPNVFNRCGLSPLMKACKDHHIDAVRLLVKHGADVNAQCPPLFEPKSPLQFAIASGNIVIVNILLGRGSKIVRYGEYKYSALHSAVLKGRADICRVLLQYGADVNERTEEGATALMLACCTLEMKERAEIVKMLIDAGADVNAHAPCYSYFDPYLAPITEYFKNIGNSEDFSIIKMLLCNGAKVHFCSSEIESSRRRDPFSILPYCHCLSGHYDTFFYVLDAAAKFNPMAVYVSPNISESMKDQLLLAGTRVLNLKHLTRLTIHARLGTGIPDKVMKLPLPEIIKSYLLYK
ncbi:ANK3-like protein [Mya arenaria]|uniref:ANK3-like protein n=1 Tax=Mya arenaria TaxID=6604 RepID=A0ABY7DRL7_MYAAR|nr:putative ankyrin repeat protein RF_0381 [Mya arenaria]WAQ97595.1 ANK3-like protein [Mya arenaria]